MDTQLHFDILPQPDNTTCGPTCLQAVYQFFGDPLPLTRVIRETEKLEEGGALSVQLACHALRRGYVATIYTWDLHVFDPTWFRSSAPPLRDRLTRQEAAKGGKKLQIATRAYLEFLDGGGRVRMEEFTPRLFRKYLSRSIPILTGLSATYLYHEAREYGPQCVADDVRGFPVGHFVVLCGHDTKRGAVLVADPFLQNPLGPEHFYEVSVSRAICAILLGAITYDANLLIIEPPSRDKGVSRVGPDRRQ